MDCPEAMSYIRAALSAPHEITLLPSYMKFNTYMNTLMNGSLWDNTPCSTLRQAPGPGVDTELSLVLSQT